MEYFNLIDCHIFKLKKAAQSFQSTISLIPNAQNMHLIENHFNAQLQTQDNESKRTKPVSEWFEHNANEMETSLDEGIGSHGSNGSLSNNNAAKSSPINSECLKTVAENASSSRVSAYMGFDEFHVEKNVLPLVDDTARTTFEDNETNYDDAGDLDVNVDDDEINNIDEDFNDQTRDDKDLDDDYSNEFKQSKLNKNASRLNFFNEHHDTHQTVDPLDSLSLNNPTHPYQEPNSILYWPSQISKSPNDELNEKVHEFNDETTILTYPPRRSTKKNSCPDIST